MNLLQVISNLSDFDEDHTIYAEEPWSPDSEAMVRPEPEDGSVPGDASAKGLTYFIEVFLAKEFLHDWAAGQPREPSSREKAERLIKYAVDDA